MWILQTNVQCSDIDQSRYLFRVSDASSGGSTDWMMATAGMPYTFVPELRGSGFDVSPSLIPLSVNEMWNGLVAMMDEIMSQNP